jgi:hypothetical protein
VRLLCPISRRSGDDFARTARTAGTVGTNPFDTASCMRPMVVRESARELAEDGAGIGASGWRHADDRQSVPDRMAGAPRSGAPATYTPEQICAVMTCEKPSERSGQSAIGASARLPTKRCAAAWCRASRNAQWGVF